LRYKSR